MPPQQPDSVERPSPAKPPRRTAILLAVLGVGAALSAYGAIRHHFDRTEVHGLPPARRSVHVVSMSPAFFASDVKPRIEEDACTNALVDAAGLASRNDLQRLLAPYMADALYLPGTDSVFILGTKNMLRKGVLAHEMAHAIQDQYVDLGRLTKAPSVDEDIATRATLEGVAILAVDSLLPPGTPRPFSTDVIGNWSALIYEYGPLRVWQDRRPWIVQSAHPALTTQAVMFGIPPQSLLPLVTPPAPPIREGDVPSCTSRLGALAALTAFQRFGAAPAMADGAALAWRGDRATIVLQGRVRRFFWRVAFAPGAERLGQIWRTWYPDSGLVLEH